MTEALLRIELYGPRPGTGDNWLLDVRDHTGAVLVQVTGSRDIVLAAFAEFVEELHT